MALVHQWKLPSRVLTESPEDDGTGRVRCGPRGEGMVGQHPPHGRRVAGRWSGVPSVRAGATPGPEGAIVVAAIQRDREQAAARSVATHDAARRRPTRQAACAGAGDDPVGGLVVVVGRARVEPRFAHSDRARAVAGCPLPPSRTGIDHGSSSVRDMAAPMRHLLKAPQPARGADRRPEPMSPRSGRNPPRRSGEANRGVLHPGLVWNPAWAEVVLVEGRSSCPGTVLGGRAWRCAGGSAAWRATSASQSIASASAAQSASLAPSSIDDGVRAVGQVQVEAAPAERIEADLSDARVPGWS